MFKSAVLLCVAFCVMIEARPKWQFLPAVPGYVPVYIQTGDTPLEQINPELAEAFHALPAGRSASKQIEASPEELADQPREETPKDETPREETPKEETARAETTREETPREEIKETPVSAEDTVDHRPYAKKLLEKKKKANSEVATPIERT